MSELEAEARPIPGLPGYQAATDGRILGVRGGWLKLFTNPRGYLCFNVVRVGVHVQLRVHVAVCEAFHGTRPDGYHVAHLNGDQKDNRATNLAWCTPEENEGHKRVHGTLRMGSRHPAAKLTEADVSEIRQALAGGIQGIELSRQYGVTRSVISQIKKRKTWRHVQ